MYPSAAQSLHKPVPHGRGAGNPSLPVQGQGVLGLSGLSQASRAGSRLEKRGQLWVTGPRTAGTAAITSGLERAARGGEPALISRPGTRAGAGAADAAAAAGAGAAQAHPRPAGRRREAVAPCDAVGQEAWEGPGQGDSTPGWPASPHSSVPPGTAIRGFQSLSLIGFIFAS